MSHELDWSKEDRRHLDNFVVARCVRRFVLEEAFEWNPDPVADALAKMNAKMGMETPADGAASAADDADDGVGGGDDASIDGAGDADADADDVAAAEPATDSAPAAAAAEGSVEMASQGEGWVSGRFLQKFKGDWMALARKRTGRPAAGGGRRQGGRRRRDGRNEMAAPALEANVRSRR